MTTVKMLIALNLSASDHCQNVDCSVTLSASDHCQNVDSSDFEC